MSAAPKVLTAIDAAIPGECKCGHEHCAINRTRNDLIKARADVAELIATLKTAQWMLERDYIDDQKMAVIDKCRNTLARIGGDA